MPGVLGDEPCRLIVSPVLAQGGHSQFTFAILTKRRKISDHEDLFYTGIVLAALHWALSSSNVLLSGRCFYAILLMKILRLRDAE